MRCRLFNLFTAWSFVVCLVATTFAVRGIWRTDWVSYGGNSYTAMAASMGSSAWLTFWLDAEVQPRGLAAASELPREAYFADPPAGQMDWLGFSAYTGRTESSAFSRFGGNRPYASLIVPHWMIAAAAAILPALWLIKKYRGGFGAGRCRCCGYDLRATPDRCPECGTATAVGTEAE